MSQCRYRTMKLSYLSLQSVVVGFICVVGFEINGLLFLYLWATYLICALTSHLISFKNAFFLTFILVLSTLLFYALLIWLYLPARINNAMYFSTQLFPALLGQRTDNLYNGHGLHRLIVVGLYFKAISPWFLIVALGWLTLEFRAHLSHTPTQPPPENQNKFIFYSILSIITTAPLLASAKILNYYNLQTNAFLTLLLCSVLTPALQAFFQSRKSKLSYLLDFVAASALCYALCWPTIFYFETLRTYSQSRLALSYTQLLQHYIPPNSIVSFPPYILPHAITALEPELARFLNISMMPAGGCQYYLDSIYDFLPPPEGYHEVKTPMLLLTLYQRKEALSTCKPHEETLQEYHSFGNPLILFI
jgi:hypothetical protein